MARTLPPRPSLQQYRKQAKELVRAHRAGDPSVPQRLREHLPRLARAADGELRAAALPLHDAQWVIAREHGFSSWSRFKQHLEALRARNRAAPKPAAPVPEDRPTGGERPMLATALQNRSDLSYYEAQAQEILAGHRAGDPAALDRLRWNLPGFRQKKDSEIRDVPITLDDTRRAVARACGFEDWPALADGLESARTEGRFHPDFDRAVDAIITGDAETLRSLLEKDPALPRSRSWLGHRATLLNYVAANGVEGELQKTPPNAPEIARMLLEAGSDPNATCGLYEGGSGSTPLVGLVSSTHPSEAGVMGELVRVLCEGGALVDGIEGDGHPLAVALGFWYPEAVEALAVCGAAVENVVFAAAAGRTDLIEQYVAEGGTLAPGAPRTPRLRWLNVPEDPKAEVETAFVYACMCGQTEVVELLLKLGVDINAAPQRGETGLHLAAWTAQREMVQLLFRRGVNGDLPDARFLSPAWGWARHHGHQELAKLMLERAVSTSLFAAVVARRLDRVRALLDEHPELINDQRYWSTPLDQAVVENDVEIVRELLARGADPNLAGREDGLTPLQRAEARGAEEIAALLRAGA